MADMDEKEKTLEVLQKMTEVLEGMNKTKEQSEDLHTKAPAQYMTAQKLHGWNGVFSSSGIEREVITAHIRPEGLATVLPLLPTQDENPLFASLTGFGEYAGAEPTYVCDDAPSGYLKGALLTARFGRVRRDTNTIDMTQAIRRINRGDQTDLVLRGRLLGLSGLTPADIDEAGVLDIVTKSEMVITSVMAERKLSKMLWQGSFAVAGEFPGLDVQIATGQKDAETGTLAPSLDSDVKNYNFQALGPNIVEYICMEEWYLQNNARKMGLDPVEYVIVMRPDLFGELTAVWPIVYNTTRGNVVASTQNVSITLDGRTNVEERDAMRNGHYLDVNGKRYNVILDDGVFEKNSTNSAGLIKGQYASSIYFVPLTMAGMPVTFRQYLDYRQAQPDVGLLKGMNDFFWTDNGLFSWAYTQSKWCFKLSLLTEQRVVLRTPQLAGRIDNVKYEPLQHLRDADASSPYFVDGGVSLRNTGNFTPYAAWTSR
jgi:hypothetical protein